MRTALLAVALTAGPLLAQDQPYPASGSELFRGILHRYGYKPATVGYPQPRVVVVYGRADWPSLPAECRRVLASGGSVLLADASPRHLEDLFSGRWANTVVRAAEPQARRELKPRQPVVELTVAPSAAGRLGLQAVNGVVTKTPAVYLSSRATGNPWVDTVVADVGVGRPFAVGGTGPADQRGKALVLADESVLSNRLLAGQFADDTDTRNLEFAVALARWLKPPGDGPVPCLFVDHGRPIVRFDEVDYSSALVPQLPTPPPPSLSDLLRPEAQAKLADAVNEAINKVQTDDRLNDALTRRGRFGRTIRWILGVLALLATVAMVRRARSARRPQEPPAVKPEPGKPGKPAGPFAQRREELLRGGDHTAAVREYLVELFRHHGLPLDEYRHPKRMPRVEANAVTRRRVATLWEAAYGPHPVSYTRWKELEPMIESVRADGAAGRWRFAGGRA